MCEKMIQMCNIKVKSLYCYMISDIYTLLQFVRVPCSKKKREWMYPAEREWLTTRHYTCSPVEIIVRVFIRNVPNHNQHADIILQTLIPRITTGSFRYSSISIVMVKRLRSISVSNEDKGFPRIGINSPNRN